MRPALTKLIILLFFVITGFNSVWSQSPSECTINQSNCPPPDLMQACADTVVGGIFGAYVYWTGPDFSLSCDSTGVPGYAFEMSFDIPESQSELGCWLFSKVQRTGTGGGRLRLWQSTQSNTNPNPNFTTPSFFLPSTSTNASMTITNGSGQNITCNVYLVYPDGTLSPLNATFNISGTNVYNFTVTPPHFGIYRLFFEFTGSGNNMDYVELLRINASLYGTACTGDINFYNFSTSVPGDFFPIGTTPVSYISILRDASGNIVLSDSCNFNVIVNGVKATAVKTDAYCSLNNGSISITAQSSSASPQIQYSLNGGGWVNFAPGSLSHTISNLSTGSYLIDVRDISLIGNCKIIHPINVAIGRIVDNTAPSIACAANTSIAGCSTSAITGLAYSEVKVIISAGQFTTAGGIASDSCGIVEYSYKDTKVGTCPIVVSRVFSVKDLAGNTSSCTQTITIYDNTKPVFSNIAGSLDKSFTCASMVPAVNTSIVSATDNCGGVVTITHLSDVVVNGSCANKFVLTRTYRATDPCGNFSDFVQTITVNDNVNPVIVCAGNMNANTDLDKDYATITVITPQYSDNCGAVSITNSITGSADASGLYPIGTTNIVWTATDICGNSSTCIQVITVTDNEKPVIHCPENIVSCSPSVTIIPATATDNSGIASIVGIRSDLKPLTDPFPVGTTTITWTATDIHGSSSTCQQTVKVSDIKVSATGSSQVSCHNASDGIITVTASGGMGAFSYSLNGGVAQSGNVFSGLAAGTYTVLVSDANGCSAATEAIIISNPPLLTASAAGSSQVTCHNTHDGNITVTASGGTGALTYSLNGGTPQVSNIFSGLASGSYTVVVRDTKGCSVTTNTIIISNPAAVSASAVGSSQVSCHNASDGMITVTASGGTGILSYNLNGGAPQPSNIFSELAAGTYTVLVSDENGCSTTTEALIISNPPLLAASAEGSSQVSCHNASDGMITVTASGGTGALSYSLNGGIPQPSNIFSGLAAGNYSVVVRDANGCSVTTNSIVIANPSAVIASATGSSQVSCHNASDGMITVTASGGTGALSYSLNGGIPQPSNIFSGLTAGTYTVVVRDINGCSAITGAVIISNPPLLIASAQGSSQESCHNISDGVITVTASGGTGVLTYSLNGGIPQTSNIFSGLAHGTYTVVVRDEMGCSATTNSIIITNPTTVVASAQGSSQVSCHNASDGIIIVTASGGTGVLSYSLNGGIPQPSNIFSDLTAGTYSVVVSDINGCSAITSTLIIRNPETLNATAIGSPQVSCHNSSDGKVIVYAYGGTGDYSYSLNGGNPQTSNVFEGLAAGTYTVVVRDEKGCSATAAALIIANPEQMVASAMGSSQVGCHDASDGFITVTATGGTGELSYSLNGGAPQESNIFSNLVAGTYTVVVLDEKGCSGTTEALIIANPELLTASAVGSSQVSCFGVSDGEIRVTANGGTGSYNYSINGGTPQTSSIFNGLSADSYIVVVRDENGCSATTNTIFIEKPELLVASAEGSSQVSCFDASDGTIAVTATGGTGGYKYSLNGGIPQESNIFHGLTAGTYTVVVFDENGCSAATEAITIKNPELLTASAEGSSQVSCADAADGIITVSASGGTGRYRYSLNGGEPQESNVFSGLTAGTYSVIVTDVNGCSAKTAELTINNPAVLTAYADGSSQVSCNNSLDGMITVTASGGTGTYSYSLNGGLPQESNTFEGLAAGSYSVMVSDANGCTAMTDAIIIENPTKLTLTAIGSEFVTCHNGNDGVINLRAFGGSGYYRYALNDGPYQVSSTFTNLSAGSYTAKVIDGNTCTAETFKSIYNPGEIIATAIGKSHVSCYGSTDGAFTVLAEGGIGDYQYSINGVDYQSNNYFDNLAPGEYNITVIDGQSCMGKATFVISPQEPIITNLTTVNAECHGMAGGSAEVRPSGGTPPYRYEWSNGTLSANATDLAGGTYIITITDANNCKMYQTVNIEMNKIIDIEPVNVFTPNEDGINDTWKIKNIEFYPENELVIINRWGNEVYTQKVYNNEWNGSQLNEGTYFYVLKVTMCNEERKYSGFITIIK